MKRCGDGNINTLIHVQKAILVLGYQLDNVAELTIAAIIGGDPEGSKGLLNGLLHCFFSFLEGTEGEKRPFCHKNVTLEQNGDQKNGFAVRKTAFFRK